MGYTFELRDDEVICHCCQQIRKVDQVTDCNVCGKEVCKDNVDCMTHNHLDTQANVCGDCLKNISKMMHYYAAELVKAEEIKAAKVLLLTLGNRRAEYDNMTLDEYEIEKRMII